MGEVIFALDDERLEAALGWVDRLKERISWFKIGSALFTRYGPNPSWLPGKQVRAISF